MSGAIYLGEAECAKEAALAKWASGDGRECSAVSGSGNMDTRVGSSGGDSDGVVGGYESVGDPRWPDHTSAPRQISRPIAHGPRRIPGEVSRTPQA